MAKLRLNLVSYAAILRQQMSMHLAAWKRILVAPVLNIALYFIVFGEMLGAQVGAMGGHSFEIFIAPGLIMMAIFASSFGAAGSSFAMSKSTGQINDLLITPTSMLTILTAYISGGVFLGLTVGSALTLTIFLFQDIPLSDPFIAIVGAFLIAVLFSLAGLLNAILSTDSARTGWLPIFVLSPLTYLGGIFFTLDMLPEVWQRVAALNPMLYMINFFRFGMIGSSEVELGRALAWLLGCVATLFVGNLILLMNGYDLRE